MILLTGVRCIVKAEPIHLSVTEKPPIEVERPHQFSVSTITTLSYIRDIIILITLQWLSVDPYSNRAMHHSNLSSCVPICHKEVCSAWEIANKLRYGVTHQKTPILIEQWFYNPRLTKIQIGGFPKLPRSTLVHLELQLLHGCSPELCECIVSSHKMASPDLTWIEDMEFNIEIRNIPKVHSV